MGVKPVGVQMKHDSHQLIKIKAGWVHGCTMITQSIMPVLCIFKTCDNCLKTKRQWKSLMVSWKFLNMKLSWSSNSIPIYTSRGAESKALTQYQYTSIHRSIIHNSQKVETTPMSINWWGGKQSVWPPDNAVLFGHRKKWHTETCRSKGEPWKCYTKWNNQSEGYFILIDTSFLMRCPV